MTNINSISLGGHVTNDPRMSANGKFAYFDVAVNRGDKAVSYIPVRVLLNDYYKQNIKKGTAIVVHGRFESGSFTASDGTKKYYTYVTPSFTNKLQDVTLGLSTNFCAGTIIGNLVADPEVRTTSSGAKVTRITIACNCSQADKQDVPSFITVNAWEKTGEIIAQHCNKGDPLVISNGYFTSSSYKAKDGSSRTSYSFTATEIAFASWKKADGTNAAKTATQNNQSADYSRSNAPVQTPAPASPTYGNYEPDDFSSVDDGDDLPF